MKGKGTRGWKNDKSVGAENQLDNDYYKDRKSAQGEKIPNPYDRGHMVMCFNNMWGSTKKESDKDESTIRILDLLQDHLPESI